MIAEYHTKKEKIYDNAKVLKKRGKIKSVGTGVYVKA